MNTLIRCVGVCLVIWLAWCNAVEAQKQALPPPPPKKVEAQARDVKKDAFKDPTALSPKLKEVLNPARMGKSGSTLPKIKLRGLILVGEQSTACIEVGGVNLLVQKGDVITAGSSVVISRVEPVSSAKETPPVNSNDGAMRVLAITDREVLIEGFGGIIVVR